MCSDSFFIRDETSDELPVLQQRILPETLAGLPVETAEGLLLLVEEITGTLMKLGLDRETACKKIRWATHVVANRD